MNNKGEIIYSDDDMASEGDSDAEAKPMSKKKARKMARLTVAELKQLRSEERRVGKECVP